MKSEWMIYTSVCEEDLEYIPRYLQEMERLEVCFAMHFDKCESSTKELVESHPNCYDTTSNDDLNLLFSERHKQGVLDIAQDSGAQYITNLDIDETFEQDIHEKLDSYVFQSDQIAVRCFYKQLWGDPYHIRNDRFGHTCRDKFLRVLKDCYWHMKFDFVNGPDLINKKDRRKVKWPRFDPVYPDGIVVLHWGAMLQEVREEHKERWDKIYGSYTKTGKSPYGYHNMMVDSDCHPKPEEIISNPYLPKKHYEV